MTILRSQNSVTPEPTPTKFGTHSQVDNISYAKIHLIEISTAKQDFSATGK